MNHPILTICIATYNRSDVIGTTIESILPQLSENVELLVVDGASTDSTEAVMNNYVGRSPFIRYIRLEKKGGVDQDYDRTVHEARGEFCWLFTDDDILVPGAVAKVLSAISMQYDVIIVNSQVCNRDLSIILQDRRLDVLEDKAYSVKDKEQFFIDSIGYLSFIGALVIKKSLWQQRDRKSYYGTEFIHVGVLFQKPIDDSILIIAEPLIKIRYGNAQWSSRSFEIWNFQWPKLVWSFKEYSDASKARAARKEPWRNYKDLIIHRSEGGYTYRMYKKHFSGLPLSPIWKLGALIIALTPGKLIYWFYYLYSRRNSYRRNFFDNQYAASKYGSKLNK